MLSSLLHEYLLDFQKLLQATSWAECIAVCTGLASVWLARKNSILLYPTGLVSVTLYIFLCFQAKLYADMGVNVYYLVMSLYGWYNWKKIQREGAPTVSYAGRGTLKILSIVWGISFLFICGFLKYVTDTDVPAWDASSTSLAVVAMWLMTEKKIESWMFWILSDLIAIPLYAYKGLLLSAVQYMIFVSFAVVGLIHWIRLEKRSVPPQATHP